MRKMLYKLQSGALVPTLAEAKASKENYTVVLETITEAVTPVSEKRRRMLGLIK
jgi:hypothetical protein